MADDQLGQRKDSAPKTPWTKIFSTFKVALDVKKLLLAAAGILVMALGWWVLSEVFFQLGGTTPPQWSEYKLQDGNEAEYPERWESFRTARHRWNLRYKLAGRPSGDKKQEADLADSALEASYKEYEALERIHQEYGLLGESISVKSDQELKTTWIAHRADKYPIVPAKPDDKAFESIKGGNFELRKVRISNEKDQTIILNTTEVKIEDPATFKKFKDLRSGGKEIADIRREIQGRPTEYGTALVLYERYLAQGQSKPHGQLRTLPWFENRGPNPYLVVTGQLREPLEGSTEVRPDGTEKKRLNAGTVGGWFLRDQVPVLLEPLYKFLRPVIYLFEPNAGFWNRLYLLLIILWAVLTWAYFGGAICRMAAVQLSRNEKVGLREALGFARSRVRSFFFAPFLPLLFIGLLTFFLIIFGILIGHTYFFGDIFLVPLFWPIVLVFGLIMAVVLVGLVGYPLMNPTIATEGTDSFDALSRSYSYVYQAPWHYLWYSFLALVYGAVLIFFVGLMGSLMVYLGKWGLSQAPWLGSSRPDRDREPHYLFVWAPTSFGWRDLLISDSRFAERKIAISPGGVVTSGYEMSKPYMENMSIPNYIGAVFVTIWVYLFFLLIVGFGYSYFWTASTLIYLLMRRHVDETDMDEVYLEDEEGPDAFTQDNMAPSAPKPSAPPAGGGLQMVDAPSLRTTPPASPTPTMSPPTTSSVTPSAATPTQTTSTTSPPVSPTSPLTTPTSPSNRGNDRDNDRNEPHVDPPLSTPDETDVPSDLRRSESEKKPDADVP